MIKVLYTCLAIVLFSSSYLIRKKIKPIPIQIDQNQALINTNSTFNHLFNLGHKNFISASIYLVTMLQSDLKRDSKNGSTSWFFLRFSTITDLSPQLYEAYLFGSQYLSVIKDDPWNAIALLKKSESNFPDDFWLNFYKGFNYYFELGDAENAISSYEKIINHPNTLIYTPYLPSILAKLKIKNKTEIDLKDLFNSLFSFYETLDDNHPAKKSYHQNLYSIKAEIDLNCLNSLKDHCDIEDFNGDKYVKNDFGYTAKSEWKKYRLSSNAKIRHKKEDE